MTEVKFDLRATDDLPDSEDVGVAGYASLWGAEDQGGDVVEKGAVTASLRRLKDEGRSVKMLWQHDPSQVIGLWDEVREDSRGLFVRGRILPAVTRGREVAALVRARAVDGLSIGYRTVRATRDPAGRRRLLEIDLWEVSLVTFPMLRSARLSAKSDLDLLRDLAEAAREARTLLAT